MHPSYDRNVEPISAGGEPAARSTPELQVLALPAERPLSRARALPILLVIACAFKVAGIALGFATDFSGAAVAFFIAPDASLLYALFVPGAQGLGQVYTRFVTSRPTLWLTIDDGPDEHDTLPLLDLLDRHGAKATFFLIGERAARWPQLVREIIRRGHEVGHHTHTHPTATFWCATPGRIDAELDEALAVFQRIGVRPRRFRAPAGIKNFLLDRALSRRGLQQVGWSLRSDDCRITSPEKLVASAAHRLQPGTIVLVHEGPSVHPTVRIQGIALLLEEMARRGLRCELPDDSQLR